MLCQICAFDYDSSEGMEIPCICKGQVCFECLTCWIMTEVQDLSYFKKQDIRCFNAECKQSFSISTVLPNFPTEFQDRIQVVLLNNYLNNTQDIRRCPKKSCNYAGIISKTYCKENIECELCKNQWRDCLNYNWWEKIWSKLSNIKNRELLSDVWEEVFANKCPQCCINIERNGGCPHITCKSCQFEFCWYCKRNWKQHLESECFKGVAIRIFLLFTFLINIAFLTGISNQIWIFICWFIRILLIGILIIIVGILLINILNPPNSWNGKIGPKIKALMMIAIILGFLFFIYKLKIIFESFAIAIFEGIVIGLACAWDAILKKWVDSVY